MDKATSPPGATDELFSALYKTLRRLARRELARGANGGVSVGVTSLLHEAYLGMADGDGNLARAFPDRDHFMSYAARVMRGLIIDHIRRRAAQKRGGHFVFTTLRPEVAARPSADGVDHRELERIGEALDRLAEVDPPLAELVDLKFFCGFSFCEIASMRGVSERTVQRAWDRARLFLHGTVRSGSLV